MWQSHCSGASGAKNDRLAVGTLRIECREHHNVSERKKGRNSMLSTGKTKKAEAQWTQTVNLVQNCEWQSSLFPHLPMVMNRILNTVWNELIPPSNLESNIAAQSRGRLAVSGFIRVPRQVSLLRGDSDRYKYHKDNTWVVTHLSHDLVPYLSFGWVHDARDTRFATFLQPKDRS